MSIYDDMRVVATDVFAEFKQGVIQYVGVTTGTGGTPDEPAAPVEAAPITLNATARPVSTKYVDRTSVFQTDIQVTIPNDGRVVPKGSGFLLIDGVNYKIVEIMARPAAGDPITWTVIVRR